MPKDYDPHYEDEQDWDPVVFKRSEATSNLDDTSPQPLHRRIYLARSKSKITAHELAQKMHMKIKQYDLIERGQEMPTPQCLAKLRRFINLEI